MRFLLDTHTLLWLAAEPARIPDNTRELLSSRVNELVVSAVTAFELATKYRIGKLPEAQAILAAYPDVLSSIGGTEVSISSHHGLIAGTLDWAHRDPFDRLLAAQSISESIPLVTWDPAFATLRGIQVVWG